MWCGLHWCRGARTSYTHNPAHRSRNRNANARTRAVNEAAGEGRGRGKGQGGEATSAAGPHQHVEDARDSHVPNAISLKKLRFFADTDTSYLSDRMARGGGRSVSTRSGQGAEWCRGRGGARRPGYVHEEPGQQDQADDPKTDPQLAEAGRVNGRHKGCSRHTLERTSLHDSCGKTNTGKREQRCET